MEIIHSTLKNNHIKLVDNTKTCENLYVNLVPGELSQVIINIVNNAKDALLDNKIVNPWIKIDLEEIENSKVIISIEDNAGGIDESIIDKIFDPYFTTKDDHNGTGLGLSMSKQIVTQSLGGDLSVQNTKNGAKFIIEMALSS